MKKINCSVNNCSHNEGGACKSNRIDIGGSLSETNCTTCCGSFLDKNTYGELTNNMNEYTGETALVCSAKACCHNENKICTLDSITIESTTPVKVYTETYCSDFCAD